MIYGGGYAHAGAINYFRKKYDLPEACSFNSSYLMWVPAEKAFDNQIMIDDVLHDSKSGWFQEMTLRDSIENPFAREKGYIYYRQHPKIDLEIGWSKLVLEKKTRYDFE